MLDHGVGFNFDCWNHYLETGDLAALDEPYPRLLRFADYLESIRGKDGLLPVENLGIPQVWIDHVAYRQQRHKQCAFNLYAAAMLEHALAPHGPGPRRRAAGRGVRPPRPRDLAAATVRRFWSPERGLFVNNLPWLDEEKTPRLCDRSLATAILFDQCPGGQHGGGAAGPGRVPGRDGAFLSLQRLLALLGPGPAGPRRRGRPRVPPPLGDHALGGR